MRDNDLSKQATATPYEAHRYPLIKKILSSNELSTHNSFYNNPLQLLIIPITLLAPLIIPNFLLAQPRSESKALTQNSSDSITQAVISTTGATSQSNVHLNSNLDFALSLLTYPFCRIAGILLRGVEDELQASQGILERAPLYNGLLTTLFNRSFDLGLMALQYTAVHRFQIWLKRKEHITEKVMGYAAVADKLLKDPIPKYAEAASQYEKAIELILDNDLNFFSDVNIQEQFLNLIYNWSLCLFFMGESSMAMKVLKHFDQEFVITMPSLLNLLGILYLNSDQRDIAADYFKRSLGYDQTQTDTDILHAFSNEEHAYNLKYHFNDLLGKESCQNRTWFVVLHSLAKSTALIAEGQTILLVKSAELYQAIIDSEIPKTPNFSDLLALYLKEFLDILFILFDTPNLDKNHIEFNNLMSQNCPSGDLSTLFEKPQNKTPQFLNHAQVLSMISKYYNRYFFYLDDDTAKKFESKISNTIDHIYTQIDDSIDFGLQIRKPTSMR